jgi:hypothetical protein
MWVDCTYLKGKQTSLTLLTTRMALTFLFVQKTLKNSLNTHIGRLFENKQR